MLGFVREDLEEGEEDIVSGLRIFCSNTMKGKSDLGFENVEKDRIERKNREVRRICKYID